VEDTDALYHALDRFESAGESLSNAYAALAGKVQELENELRRSREELTRATRLSTVGEGIHAACMAHEVRNPLTGIAGFASLLADAFPEGHEHRMYAEHIVHAVRNLENVVSGVLDFAKGGSSPSGVVCVHEAVCDVQCLARSRLKRATRAVETITDVASGLYVWCDPGELRHALLNLVFNAADAMPDGGTLTITARTEAGGRVRVAVADTGCGLPPEDVGRVFSPFYTTKSGGTGLGLTMVQRIVRAHGGTASVSSRPGQGTEVALHLRAARKPTQPEEEKAT
jgi:signal transduction histidine kinase